MGTGFDCMDELSHNDNAEIGDIAQHNRRLLQMLMVKYGFQPLKENGGISPLKMNLIRTLILIFQYHDER